MVDNDRRNLGKLIGQAAPSTYQEKNDNCKGEFPSVVLWRRAWFQNSISAEDTPHLEIGHPVKIFGEPLREVHDRENGTKGKVGG